MRRKLIALAGATLFLAAACGGDDEPTSYDDDVRDAFMSQCVAGAGEEGRDVCQCTYDALVDNMPFEEFKEYDDAVREDPSTPLPAEVTDAMTGCMTTAP